MKSLILFGVFAMLTSAACTQRKISPKCDMDAPNAMAEMDGVRYYARLQDAIRCSKATGRPILLVFAGYSATSSRSVIWAPLSDSNVKQVIDDRLILCALLVDDRRTLTPEDLIGYPPLKGNPTTIGDRALMFEREYFNSVAQPLYVLLDPSLKPLTTSHGYVPRFKVDEFVDWMNAPLENLP